MIVFHHPDGAGRFVLANNPIRDVVLVIKPNFDIRRDAASAENLLNDALQWAGENNVNYVQILGGGELQCVKRANTRGKTPREPT